mmetsp:Transcript_156450/g.284629  ORF Transcript_156450/g.284629 Transcript_156450/m.284629 type:complete len:136 (-) Transcript_156450:110-517(-)
MHFPGVWDLVSRPPPMSADMIIVKEVIQHLPLDMGLRMLQNAKAANIKWLAVTTNPKYHNQNVPIGSWFPGPNAEAAPFNFGAPAETCGKHDLRLYNLQDWPGGGKLTPKPGVFRQIPTPRPRPRPNPPNKTRNR